MPIYKAPVDDALFLLNDVFHLDHYGNLPGFSDASSDVVEAVLREAAKFSEEQVNSFLEEELPGSGLFTAVDPSAVDALLGPTPSAGARTSRLTTASRPPVSSLSTEHVVAVRPDSSAANVPRS